MLLRMLHQFTNNCIVLRISTLWNCSILCWRLLTRWSRHSLIKHHFYNLWYSSPAAPVILAWDISGSVQIDQTTELKLCSSVSGIEVLLSKSWFIFAEQIIEELTFINIIDDWTELSKLMSRCIHIWTVYNDDAVTSQDEISQLVSDDDDDVGMMCDGGELVWRLDDAISWVCPTQLFQPTHISNYHRSQP